MRQITAIGEGGAADWSLGHKLRLPEGYTLCLGDPRLGVHPHSEFVPGMVADVCMLDCTVCCLLDGDDGEWFKRQVEEAGGRWVYHAEGILPIHETPKTTKKNLRPSPTRNLAGRSYDQMTHDEILSEHGKRYEQNTGRTAFETLGPVFAFVAVIAIAFGMLWGVVALIKWMWIHS